MACVRTSDATCLVSGIDARGKTIMAIKFSRYGTLKRPEYQCGEVSVHLGGRGEIISNESGF